jgi:hypothetical protein
VAIRTSNSAITGQRCHGLAKALIATAMDHIALRSVKKAAFLSHRSLALPLIHRVDRLLTLRLHVEIAATLLATIDNWEVVNATFLAIRTASDGAKLAV